MKKLFRIATALCALAAIQATAIEVKTLSKRHDIAVEEQDMGDGGTHFKVTIDGVPCMPGALMDQMGWGPVSGVMLAMLPAASVLDDDPASVSFRDGEPGEVKAVLVAKDGTVKFLRFDSRPHQGALYVVREMTDDQAGESSSCNPANPADSKSGCIIL